MSYLGSATELAGRYRIGDEIGRGGHSVVYRARDLTLGVDVAVKLLVPPPATMDLARERLRREVRAVRRLAHPHIVPIHDYLTDGPWHYVVMRLVEGPDLEARVRGRGPLSVLEGKQLGISIADALALAHQEGILHRDVKPRNILLDAGGAALLTDFGSARVLAQETMTETGGLVGTPAYAAPELMQGRRADPRSDVYALGLTLYYALTGRLPEQPATHLPPAPRAEGFHPRAELPALPAWVDGVIARATVADPDDRFPTAALLRDALEAEEHQDLGFVTQGGRCLVCGEPDPTGLTLCARCGPAAAPTDQLILLDPVPGSARSERIDLLLTRFGRAKSGTSHHAVASGTQPLARVPQEVVLPALDRLASRGISARAVPVRSAWRAVPISLWAVSLAALVVGVAAGSRVHPMLLWSAPLMAGLLVIAGVRMVRTPLLEGTPIGARLPDQLERAVLVTSASLPGGTARELFSGVIRLARLLLEGESVPAEQQALVGELIPVACQAAQSLARLDAGLALLTAGAGGGAVTSPAALAARGEREQERDRLVQRILEMRAALERWVTAPTGAEPSLIGELRALTGALERDAAAWEAAQREVAGIVS
jgi:serine/threonine protein kinase